MTNRVAVLVVEDEALILLDIADQLEADGFKVYQAMNADAAIELLATQLDIRIVFTDIDMPGTMDGLKLAAAVRDRWPPVRIIVTSGARMIDADEMPDGSVFFGKPYNHLAVVRSMREMLAA
ncbi:MAG TPA: response regulator [Pseudorhizobium sp.]|nr:response regulator [Pseudorhizobium sp.]